VDGRAVCKYRRCLGALAWNDLRNAIEQHAKLVLEPPQQDLPDIVFTANAGIVLGRKVIVSRFRSVERQGEEPHHRAWFAENGFEILDWPQDVPFEGAGDALFDRGQELLWVGPGFRSDAAVPALLEKLLGRKAAALNLIDPRFYHLDTCLCPLASGYLLYFPAAFDEKSRALIELLVPKGKRIEVDEADALQFCCNAVDLEGYVFMNDASENLQKGARGSLLHRGTGAGRHCPALEAPGAQYAYGGIPGFADYVVGHKLRDIDTDLYRLGCGTHHGAVHCHLKFVGSEGASLIDREAGDASKRGTGRDQHQTEAKHRYCRKTSTVSRRFPVHIFLPSLKWIRPTACDNALGFPVISFSQKNTE
jgi:N-dimethylarginine dimethylaminohydrolase